MASWSFPKKLNILRYIPWIFFLISTTMFLKIDHRRDFTQKRDIVSDVESPEKDSNAGPDTTIVTTPLTTTRTVARTVAHTVRPPVHQAKVSYILLLSYQRTGSSFTGNLFHHSRNPNVYYVYEPLDLVYTSMFNTITTRAVPADLRTYPNGTIREIPSDELNSYDYVLRLIFECKMSQLPTSMLIHRLWGMFHAEMDTEEYVECLKSNNIEIWTVLDTCRANIEELCSGRFDATAKNNQLCKTVLYNKGTWNMQRMKDLKARVEKQLNNDLYYFWFMRYFQCLYKYTEIVKSCAVEHLDKVCLSKPIRVIKTVRADMITAQRTLAWSKKVKLVHSVRDPRGSLKSRQKQLWTQGIFEMQRVDRMAKCYCRNVVRDHKMYEVLHKMYPKRTMTIIFDEYLNKPVKFAKQLMQFCQVDVSDDIKGWVEKMYANVTSSRLNGQTDWDGFWSPHDLELINNECNTFFQALPYAWPAPDNSQDYI